MARFLILFIFIRNFCYSDNSIDSLRTVTKNKSLPAIERVKANFELSNSDDENLMENYCIQALLLLKSIDSTTLKLDDYYNIKGGIIGNLGYYYRSKGLIKKAQENYFTALKYAEKIDAKNLYADMKNNIGMLYYSQKQYREAIPHYLKAIEVYKQLGLAEYEARTYMNLAGAHQNLNNFPSAIFNFKKALNMFIEQKDTFYIGFAYNNIAVCFNKYNLPDSCFNYLDKSLLLFNTLNAEDEIAWTYDIICGIHTRARNYSTAEPYCLKCLTIAEKRNLPSQLASCLDNLYIINKNKGDYKQALNYFYRADSIQDSLVNNDTRLLLAKNQVEYDFSKKEEALTLESEKKAIQFKEEQKRSSIIIFSVIAILLVSLFFGYMILKSLKKEKLAKKTVLEQKEIIEEKQKEIIDSITYAKRIQEAILPPENYWNKNLPHSFVFYKPKDIVAGDFYWMEKIDNLLFFAAADCTGHGVPGALVSVVCSNALNRSLLEFNITKPGELLDKTRDLVISTFKKSDEDVKDGMDISLCCLNTTNNELQWAGANNPLWVLEKTENETGEPSAKMIHIKPDKQPIGKYAEQTPFTTHTIQLKNNSCVYIFTDGFPDQFGGVKGKKYKYKQLEEFLISISHLPMSSQKELLKSEFNEWKGTLEQIDDVCIIGVKIP